MVHRRTATRTGDAAPDGAAAARAVPAVAVQYGRPDHFLLHVSDTHFVGAGRLFGVVDVEAHLLALLEQFEAGYARPEAIIFTGDLADKGDPVAYRRLRALVEPIALQVGAELIWVMGNHDDRAAFRASLLDEPPTTAPVDAVHWLGGLRIIALDTSVPGAHHGNLTDGQLGWLAAELAVPAPEGTILAMHHPPVPSVLDLAVLVELQQQHRLAAVLAGTDVRTILAGHLHYSTTATFAGIPVSVASASCYTQDLTVPAGAMQSRDGGQAVNLVHVYPNTVMHSVVPIGSYPVLSTVSADEAAATLARAGITLPPPVSVPAGSATSFSHGAGMAK